MDFEMRIVHESKRLLFYLLEHKDAEVFCQLCLQKGISEYGSQTYSSPNEHTSNRFIQSQLESFKSDRSGKFIVILRETKKLIGVAGIFKMDEPLSDEYEINYRFSIEARGHGYATEAALAMIDYGKNQLNLTRIYASVAPSNEASKKLLIRVGMVRSIQNSPDPSEELWQFGH